MFATLEVADKSIVVGSNHPAVDGGVMAIGGVSCVWPLTVVNFIFDYICCVVQVTEAAQVASR